MTKTVNGTTTNYTYDKANQLTALGSTAWIYDGNGNLTSDGRNTYKYNAENQILAYIADANNKVKYSFTRNQAGQLIAMTDHTGSSPVDYYYEINGHGDVTGLRDTNGNLMVTYEYDAFGNITSAKGTKTTADGKLLRKVNPFRYASYFYVEETGLYYLMSRYYNAYVGRFLTRDVIPNKNLYAYAENSPVNYVDPSGYSIVPVLIKVGKVIVVNLGKIIAKSVKKIKAIGNKTKGAGKVKVPQKSNDVPDEIIKRNGTPPKGYKGGKPFENSGKNGGQVLPKNTNYKEYDVNPKVKGQDRGAERIVIGENGSAWYTNDHYQTFIRIK